MDDFDPKVKVVHLLPNTTSLIQPMDQEAIVTFKKYYLRHTCHQTVKPSDESGTTSQQFGKTVSTGPQNKTLTLLDMRLGPSP